MVTVDEEWRPVVGYEEFYEVSNKGRIKSLPVARPHAKYGTRRLSGRVLKDADNGTGHRVVSLWKNKRQSKVFVHRAVLEAFAGPCPPGMESLHADDNPANNDLENLSWGTRAENLADMIRNGKNYNASKAHCKRGHALVGDNLLPGPLRAGRRDCRACGQVRRIGREKVRPETVVAGKEAT